MKRHRPIAVPVRRSMANHAPNRGQVVLDEVDGHAGRFSSGAALGERRGCEVQPGHRESFLGKEDGVGTGTAAEVDRASLGQPPRVDEVDEFRARPDLPGHPEEPVPHVVRPARRHGTRVSLNHLLVKPFGY
jgi:hypothetical protein